MFDKRNSYQYIEWFNRMGLNCIPLKYGDKHPLVPWLEYREKKAEISLFDRFDRFNVGVFCGPTSGNLLVVDFDAGQKIPKELLKQTLVDTTGRGCHVWFQVKKGNIFTIHDQRRGLDIKCNGYVVAPPSLHPSGKHYQFISSCREIAQVDTMNDALLAVGLEGLGTLLPDNIDTSNLTVKQPVKLKLDDIPKWWGPMRSKKYSTGGRNNALHMAVCAQRAEWQALPSPYNTFTGDQLLDWARKWNTGHCEPPLPDFEVRICVQSALSGRYIYLRDIQEVS